MDIPESCIVDNAINVDAIEFARDEASNIDHVYEEVHSIDENAYEVLHFQNDQSRENVAERALVGHKICPQCVNSVNGSPVIYSDRLIHGKHKIYAREVIFLHSEFSPSQLFFGCRSSPVRTHLHLFRDHRSEDYMPVSNLAKANHSGILYSPAVLRDVFDLEMALGPNIVLLGTSSGKIGESNTRVYHRSVDNCYSRISEIGAGRPMIFPRIKLGRMFASVKSTGYDEDTIYWFNYEDDLKKYPDAKEEQEEQRVSLTISDTQNNTRSSLLLLEPLLLMPELAATPRQNLAKNRITHSEHVKIVRMVIAYTLSFFLLAIITFYIVYFT